MMTEKPVDDDNNPFNIPPLTKEMIKSQFEESHQSIDELGYNSAESFSKCWTYVSGVITDPKCKSRFHKLLKTVKQYRDNSLRIADL